MSLSCGLGEHREETASRKLVMRLLGHLEYSGDFDQDYHHLYLVVSAVKILLLTFPQSFL